VSDRQNALVTGASSGVGRAICRALAGPAWHVQLVGRDQVRLESVAGEVRQQGGEAEVTRGDLSSSAELGKLADSLGRSEAPLHLLVHSAGVFAAGAIDAVSDEELDRTLSVNLRAPYVLTRRLLPRLADGACDVVMVNSSAVGQRRAGLSAYLASKHGLLGLTESLRQDLGPRQIRVLSVFLGATATPMQEGIYARSGRAYDPDQLLSPEDVARAILCAVEMPRGAEITDLSLRPAVPHRGAPT